MMTRTEQSARAARSEAQPHTWAELTAEQRGAARQACRILGDIAAAAEQIERQRDELDGRGEKRRGFWRFLPPIDEARLNHVILLDGGRGSGKTALLLSLLRWWQDQFLHAESPTRRGARPRAREEDPKELGELLDLTRQLVPVGLIDLQPLPRSTHLLLHVVGQFLPVVEALEDDNRPLDDRKRAPWHELNDEESPATRAWQRFLRAAAMGWDESVALRRAQLDPEAYALEVEQAERQRLDVRESFRRLVDAMADEVPRLLGTKGRPLFVISIDDADMNPERALELLELVRTLWHPRVAFLLTGDSELFVTVLRAHVLSTLRSPLPGRASLRASELTEISQGSPLRLADDIYDKAIPRPHRCKIKPLSTRSRFEFLKRHGILGGLAPIQHRLRLSSFEEYIDLQRASLRIMPDRLRGLEDLARQVRVEQRGHRDATSPVERQRITIGILEELCKATVPRFSLHGDEQDSDDSWGRSEPRPSPEGEWRCETATLAGRSLDQLRRFCIGFAPRFVKDDRHRVALADLDAAQLIMIDAGRPLMGAATGNGLRKCAAWIEISSGSTDEPLSFAWPLPDWETPLDYAAFLELWRCSLTPGSVASGVENAGALAQLPPANVGRTARLFLAAVAAYTELVRARGSQPPDSEIEPLVSALRNLAADITGNVPSWSELAATIRKRAGRLSQSLATSDSRWARRAGLLAAPESGLPPAEANRWLSALKESFGEDWTRMFDEMCRERAYRVQVTLEHYDDVAEGAIQEIIDQIDGRFESDEPRYAWKEEIRPDKQALWFGFLDKIGNINVEARNGSISMRRYLEAGRGDLIKEQVSPEILQLWRQLHLDDWQNDSGAMAAPRLAMSMWLEAVNQGGAPTIAVLKSQPRFQDLEQFYQAELTDAWAADQAGPVISVGPRLLVAPMLPAWREDVWPEMPLAKPLFELVWDLVADVDDTLTEQAAASPAWWDGVGGRREWESAELNLYPWPFVDWPAFLDSELFIDAWNKVIPRAVEAHRITSGHETIADDMAFWYIEAVRMLAGHRHIAPHWKSGVRHRELVDAFTRAHHGDYPATKAGRRWQRYAAWGRALPLLAAPESGLSREAAEAILEAVSIDDADRQALRALRSTRLFHRKRPRRPVQPELDAIDRANHDHPWVRKVEQGA
ncbi:hypothetical protein [Sorangium sp. So ce1099]|uniref:hypothetical protein n=1 Tax=Sorangium sp. So ce1099 TaxID=3133331 RepID=UPI003F625D76